MNFTKQAKDTSAICSHYASKGLMIPNDSKTESLLSDIGFYRLKGYMPTFYRHATKDFRNGTQVEDILRLYQFDKLLRGIIMKAIESLEVAVRTRLFNGMAVQEGAHWYLDPFHFHQPQLHFEMMEYIQKYVSKAYEPFIQNYLRKYTSPTLPPSWMISDILTFGKLASIYENMKDNATKKDVAQCFGTLPVFLESWLKSLNFIRNVCAHHGRLWNRRLPLKPKLPTRQKLRFLNLAAEDTNQKLYGILSCMVFMGQHFQGHFTLKNDLKSLFDAYPEIPVEAMGFPPSWRTEPIWQ